MIGTSLLIGVPAVTAVSGATTRKAPSAILACNSTMRGNPNRSRRLGLVNRSCCIVVQVIGIFVIRHKPSPRLREWVPILANNFIRKPRGLADFLADLGLFCLLER